MRGSVSVAAPIAGVASALAALVACSTPYSGVDDHAPDMDSGSQGVDGGGSDGAGVNDGARALDALDGSGVDGSNTDASDPDRQRVIFVTRSTYDGNLGGFVGADAAC